MLWMIKRVKNREKIKRELKAPEQRMPEAKKITIAGENAKREKQKKIRLQKES